MNDDDFAPFTVLEEHTTYTTLTTWWDELFYEQWTATVRLARR